MGNCPLCHAAVLMRTDVIRAVGGYRPVVVDAEDYDLWLRITDRYQLGNLEKPLLRYRRHSGQVSIQRFWRQALSAVARGYLTCIRSMTDAGEYRVARDTMGELCRLPYWSRAERALVADYHLLAVRVRWRQGRIGNSVSSAIQAVISRPIILARPLKPLIRGLGVDLRFDIAVSRLRAAIGMRRKIEGGSDDN